MSGMSQDDESKERVYSALNIILMGSRNEFSRAIVIRELDSIVVRAVDNHDFPLVNAVARIIEDIKSINLDSADLQAMLQPIKDRVYELETY